VNPIADKVNLLSKLPKEDVVSADRKDTVNWKTRRQHQRFVPHPRLFAVCTHQHLFLEHPIYTMDHTGETPLPRQVLHLLQIWAPRLPHHGAMMELVASVSSKHKGGNCFLLYFGGLHQRTLSSETLDMPHDELVQWWSPFVAGDNSPPFSLRALHREVRRAVRRRVLDCADTLCTQVMTDPILSRRLHELYLYVDDMDKFNSASRARKRSKRASGGRASGDARPGIAFIPPPRVIYDEPTLEHTPDHGWLLGHTRAVPLVRQWLPFLYQAPESTSQEPPNPMDEPDPADTLPDSPLPLGTVFPSTGTYFIRDHRVKEAIRTIHAMLTEGSKHIKAHREIIGWPTEFNRLVLAHIPTELWDPSNEDHQERRMMWYVYCFFKLAAKSTYTWTRIHLALYCVWSLGIPIGCKPLSDAEVPIRYTVTFETRQRFQCDYLDAFNTGYLRLARAIHDSLAPVFRELHYDDAEAAREFSAYRARHAASAVVNNTALQMVSNATPGGLRAFGTDERDRQALAPFRPSIRNRSFIGLLLRHFPEGEELKPQVGDDPDTRAKWKQAVMSSILERFADVNRDTVAWCFLEHYLVGYWNIAERTSPLQQEMTAGCLRAIAQLYRNPTPSTALTLDPSMLQLIRPFHRQYYGGDVKLVTFRDPDTRPIPRLRQSFDVDGPEAVALVGPESNKRGRDASQDKGGKNKRSKANDSTPVSPASPVPKPKPKSTAETKARAANSETDWRIVHDLAEGKGCVVTGTPHAIEVIDRAFKSLVFLPLLWFMDHWVAPPPPGRIEGNPDPIRWPMCAIVPPPAFSHQAPEEKKTKGASKSKGSGTSSRALPKPVEGATSTEAGKQVTEASARLDLCGKLVKAFDAHAQRTIAELASSADARSSVYAAMDRLLLAETWTEQQEEEAHQLMTLSHSFYLIYESKHDRPDTREYKADQRYPSEQRDYFTTHRDRFRRLAARIHGLSLNAPGPLAIASAPPVTALELRTFLNAVHTMAQRAVSYPDNRFIMNTERDCHNWLTSLAGAAECMPRTGEDKALAEKRIDRQGVDALRRLLPTIIGTANKFQSPGVETPAMTHASEIRPSTFEFSDARNSRLHFSDMERGALLVLDLLFRHPTLQDQFGMPLPWSALEQNNHPLVHFIKWACTRVRWMAAIATSTPRAVFGVDPVYPNETALTFVIDPDSVAPSYMRQPDPSTAAPASGAVVQEEEEAAAEDAAPDTAPAPSIIVDTDAAPDGMFQEDAALLMASAFQPESESSPAAPLASTFQAEPVAPADVPDHDTAMTVRVEPGDTTIHVGCEDEHRDEVPFSQALVYFIFGFISRCIQGKMQETASRNDKSSRFHERPYLRTVARFGTMETLEPGTWLLTNVPKPIQPPTPQFTLPEPPAHIVNGYPPMPNPGPAQHTVVMQPVQIARPSDQSSDVTPVPFDHAEVDAADVEAAVGELGQGKKTKKRRRGPLSDAIEVLKESIEAEERQQAAATINTPPVPPTRASKIRAEKNRIFAKRT
jgi:hypothetical protein